MNDIWKKLKGAKKALDAKEAATDAIDAIKVAKEAIPEIVATPQETPQETPQVEKKSSPLAPGKSVSTEVATELKVRSLIVMYVSIILGSAKAAALGFGYELPITDEGLKAFGELIGTGAMVYILLNHVKSTDKIGLFGLFGRDKD